MSEDDLYALYKLHLADARIVELKTRAATFDPTKATRTAIEKLKPAHDAAKAKLDKLSSDHTDLELKFKTLFDKLNAQINYLYSGKVTNSRESEALEKDIESLRDRADKAEEERLAVAEATPAARKAYGDVHEKMEVLKKELAVAYQAALKERDQLQADYKESVKVRNDRAVKVPAGLLAQYDAIRVKHNGIGMGEILGGKTCGACGTNLPQKIVLSAREGKLVMCESCHRILFHVLPNP
ncbi:MAG: hypothetical protein K8R88_00055 [Armatimonadetes bacterium]|nr:hypothetical protein [Armatimonadota bacterium]